MYQYRQALVRMRQGDSDRAIARSNLMGRKKLKAIRKQAAGLGWLSPELPLPDDGVLAGVFSRSSEVPASSASSLAPFRSQVSAWHDAGVQGTTIHSALAREHGFTGSYSAVRLPWIGCVTRPTGSFWTATASAIQDLCRTPQNRHLRKEEKTRILDPVRDPVSGASRWRH